MRSSDSRPQLCVIGPEPTETALRDAAEALRACALRAGWTLRQDDGADIRDDSVALVLTTGDATNLRRRFPQALVVGTTGQREVDLLLPLPVSTGPLQQLLVHARNHWQDRQKTLSLYRELGARRERMRQLSEIALSLSMRMGLDELLEAILHEARNLANCEAGSLYLIDEEGGRRELVFKLAQNDVVEVPFVESRLPLDPGSLAGYVALSGETLDIPDVYEIPSDRRYSFNRSFDREMGYRTRSMLVIPMRDHRDRIVGVLQFINRLDPAEELPIAFGEEIGELLRAVASQAAVSIEKNALIRDVNRLFETFVQASVKTIEQRDPSTSGHSFRVAETTVALLEALPQSGVARFRNLEVSEESLREVRYAALLHDFGKIGVREHVLLKANKLTDERLELIHYRVELQKERLRRRCVERLLEMMHHGQGGVEVARRRLHRELDAELSLLDEYLECVRVANRPSPLADGDFAHLRNVREYAFLELDGTRDGLISDADMVALSIRKGSLTPEERREIESHVSHTRDFLAVLPWPPELARVPAIAGAHHEKLDGSGYPEGLVGEQIPLASRVMTVCDIYDALTAMDRPYKSAMSVETALDVLHEEARRGLIDTDILNVFIESGTHRVSAARGRSFRLVV